MVDVPIDSPCCVVLTDSRIRNTGTTSDKDKTKLNEHNHWNFYAWHKLILLTVISILLIVLFLTITNLTFSVISKQDARNVSVRIQPETRLERIIRLNFPLGKRSLFREGKVIDRHPSFNDQTKLTSQITRVAKGDAFSTINGRDADTRSKREVSRRRRDCEGSAKQCENILQMVRSYLRALNSNIPPTSDETSLKSKILQCIECRKLLNKVDENDANHTPQSKDQYFPHDYAEKNRSSDFGPAVIKLLNDGEAENGPKRTEVNRTEVAQIQLVETDLVTNNPSQNVTNQSLKVTDISETTTISTDHTDSNESQRIYLSPTDINNSNVNDKQLESNPMTNDSRVIKIQNAESVPTVTKIDLEDRVTLEGKDATSARPRFTTESSSIRKQSSAITRDDEQFRKTTTATDSIETTETTIRTIIDLTKQITENVTSVPARHDVTGIDDGTVHPSVRPSLEGHPENRSTAAANGSKSTENPRNYEQFPAEYFQTKDNSKPIVSESTKSLQELQLNPKSWTVPHPVCFFGQFPNMPLSPTSALSSDPSSGKNHGFPFQNPSYQSSSLPNYMQVQANTVQILPNLNYVDGLTQPTGQGVGPTGPAISNAPTFSLNQQPTAMSQQPIAKMPYFCGYISLPSIRFPPIPGTSQSDRSADEAKHSSKEAGKLPKDQDYDVIAQDNSKFSTFNSCPINYHQCNNLHCVPRLKWCNGRVDCADASDETRCSCRDRIPRNRVCDGYFDCPHGEDELGCFGCPMDSFSCDVWNNHNGNNCVPLSQRCDGISQCSNRKDELDCNVLLQTSVGPNNIFMIGYTEGYLHKNVRGQWYPVCSKSFSWAMDACMSEIGQALTTMPEIEIVQVPEDTFKDPYMMETDTNNVQMTSCRGTAVFVKCPPLLCGTKVYPRENFSPVFNTTKNNYVRRHAEEQSASEFNKLYQETLGLLSAGQSTSEGKVQNQNDTIVGSQSRVVGGRASQPKAWPFLVIVYKDGEFHCGGVIISQVHILTASHCMDGHEGHYYEIQAGILRRLSFSPMAQSRRAKNVIIHPDYVRQAMQNDIAVIVLDKPLLFNRWVRPVCLPGLDSAGPDWKEGPSPQSVCVAIGWGALREYGPDPDHLREVEVPILSSCKELIDQTNATICAGYPEGGHDACQGDSGGPLMCRNPYFESQWYVAGIISHGDGCGRPNEPGVYMKVSYYEDWISQTQNDNYETSLSGNKLLDSCPGFSCQSGLENCLPIEDRCNGIVNCLDGEDEIGCELLNVNAGYRDSNSNNTFVKLQGNEISSDTTDENKASTEAIPVSTSSYFYYQTETQTYSSGNSNTVDIYATTPEITMSSVRLTFTCNRLIQTIMINKRCNKHLDCQDGTDEENCTCRDYLLNLQPTAICDGHLDCDDETDEKDCDICKDDEFHCSRSGGCIPTTKRCNGNFDCPLREDEVDCLALTNGEYVIMDSDNRPVLNMEGLLSRYYNETWNVECLQPNKLGNSTVTSMIGENLCKYLGFRSLQLTNEIVVNKTVLETRFLQRSWDNATDYESLLEHAAASEGGETCTTLQFYCKPVLSSSADSHLVVDPRTGSHTYLWPWLAAIFVDGRYHCTALLLESDWLLSSSSCTEAIRLSENYTTALLGQSRSYLYVDGPYQQISVVDEIRNVKTTDVSLLHLKTAVNFTRYVQPLFLEKKIYPPAGDDLCVAIGTDNEHQTYSIFLQPILQNCDKCYRCFIKTLDTKCPTNGTSSNWSGTVFCRSEQGWYPAAVFHENDGPCSFGSTQNLTSIDYVYAYLMQALEKVPQPISEPTCDGVRCKIGQCISWNQVCDGVADCRDGLDEKNEMCLKMQETSRKNGVDLKCAKAELRCKNGECVSKSAFCDGKVDCSDGTDEPILCSCAQYLKLTTPERLCDGVRHCHDKTDESPEVCQCTENSFKCNTDSKNVTCVSQDFVCDGDYDCPNGEDEMKCKKVRDLAKNRSGTGEVMQRSYGVWHTLCYPSVVTSQKEITNVCRMSGFSDGNIDYEYQIFDQPVVPSRDDFYMVRLSSTMWITMRDDKPLITLVQSEKPCYRLFVKCN